MNCLEFRKYGFVSRLSEIRCGGPSTGAVSNTASQQSGVAGTQATMGTATEAEALSLAQPAIAQQTALASGNRSAALAASMPAISQITGGYNAAQEQIMNSVPPGPARDAALANLQTQRATSTANTQAQLVEQAPSNLANIGSGLGAFSLQQVGAALSGYSGASQSEQSVMNVQEQQQAAKLGLAGSGLGMAGEIGGPLIGG
jgi:hypothetical protein